MKFLNMAILILTLSSTVALAEDHREVASTHTCRIVTGYGTAVGYGATKSLALKNARQLCGEKLMDQYLGNRGALGDDGFDAIVDACVNEGCQ